MRLAALLALVACRGDHNDGPPPGYTPPWPQAYATTALCRAENRAGDIFVETPVLRVIDPGNGRYCRMARFDGVGVDCWSPELCLLEGGTP